MDTDSSPRARATAIRADMEMLCSSKNIETVINPRYMTLYENFSLFFIFLTLLGWWNGCYFDCLNQIKSQKNSDNMLHCYYI